MISTFLSVSHFRPLRGLAMLLFVLGCRDAGSTTTTQDSSHTSPSSAVQSPPDDSTGLAFPALKSHRDPHRVEITAPTEIQFVDVAEEWGLQHHWPEQPRPMTALDAFGAGCAAFDYDNDGWQDVLLVATPHPILFHNDGGTHFTNVTEQSGLKSLAGRWTGCSIGDFDGDGLLDLVVTGYHQLALWKNQRGQQFQDVTQAMGLDPTNQGYWGASSGFMDLDGDGWLDLVILNYVIFGPETQKYCEYTPGVKSGCGPKTYLPERGQIWKNMAGKSLQLIPSEQGMQQTHGVGLVLAFTDLDDDGRIDFYIGNDGVVADLLYNQGTGHFENIAAVAGVATSDNGGAVSAMGADWGDFDRDGRLDLAVTNWFGDSFVIFQSVGNRLFVDCAKRTDLARSSKNRLGFGAKWVDFENDGWLDLFFVNGHVYDNSAEIHGPGVPFRQPMSLYWNDRGQKLIDIVPKQRAEIQRPMVGRGSATVDFDNDGRVDLLAVDFEGPAMLLQNRTETTSHWLKLDLRGKAPNRFAYGARLVGRRGDQVWISDVSPASSYLSSSDPRVHWGLGENTRLDTLTIHWPSGAEQTLHNVAADQILQISQD